MSVKASEIVTAARQLIGASYTWWQDGDPVPLWLYDYPYSRPPVEYIMSAGTMCSDLISWARMECGLPWIGGTGAYQDWIMTNGGIAFDPSIPGVPGAICVHRYEGPWAQGHIALYTDEHTLIQATDGVGSFAGVNEGEQDYDSHQWANYLVYGLQPDVDYSEHTGGNNGETQPAPSWQWIALDARGYLRADGPDWSRGWYDSEWAYHQ